MAAYHCTAKVVSRSRGQSAIAKAAYNARDRLRDEQTDEIKNYSRKAEQVLFSGIFAPKDAPVWAQDREQLWNHAERAETRKDSQLAREIEFALPHELSDQQREWLVKDFVRENFVRKGMVADVNIHAPDKDGDQRNYHAHILLTTRELTPEGFGDKVREWNSRAEYWHCKEDLAVKGAKMLERAGLEIEAGRFRWGHLTNDEQQAKALLRGDSEFAERKGQEPTRHQGPQIQEIEARGVGSDVQERRGIESANDNAIRDELAALRAERASIERQEAALSRSPERIAPEAERSIEVAAGLAVGLRDAGEGLDRAASAIEGGIAIGEAIAGKVLDTAAQEVENVIEMLGDAVSATKYSPEQMKHRAEDRAARAEDSERQRVDFNRYLKDEDYRRMVEQQRQERERSERAQQQFREQARDRDR